MIVERRNITSLQYPIFDLDSYLLTQVTSITFLAAIASTECLLVLPLSRQNQPWANFVCPTFPFCYQDLKTGVWKALQTAGKAKSPQAPTLEKNIAAASSTANCWVEGYFCRSAASTLIARTKQENAADCQAKCAEEDKCLFFSFLHTRGQGYCSLLSECHVYTECTKEQRCTTGQKTCSCPALKHFPGNKDSTEYARWTCKDVDPYSVDIQVGTVCSTSCANWKDSTLQSTCLQNGIWSQTNPPAGRALGYAAYYPTPDQPDMECGCPPVGPFTYDPNTEEGAEFSCLGWGDDQYKKDGGWTIKNSDRCELFCNNGKFILSNK